MSEQDHETRLNEWKTMLEKSKECTFFLGEYPPLVFDNAAVVSKNVLELPIKGVKGRLNGTQIRLPGEQ